MESRTKFEAKPSKPSQHQTKIKGPNKERTTIITKLGGNEKPGGGKVPKNYFEKGAPAPFNHMDPLRQDPLLSHGPSCPQGGLVEANFPRGPWWGRGGVVEGMVEVGWWRVGSRSVVEGRVEGGWWR